MCGGFRIRFLDLWPSSKCCLTDCRLCHATDAQPPRTSFEITETQRQRMFLMVQEQQLGYPQVNRV